MSHYYDKFGTLVPPWTPGAYPSPSTILSRLRSTEYEALVARMGQEAADELVATASARGTRVHKACEVWANGIEVSNIDLPIEEAPYLQGFINWWEQYQPELVATELFVYSDKYKYAGTADLIVRIDGELWLIDIKTGQDNVRHGLQLKFYQQAYYEMTGMRCRMGILALDAKRTAGYRNSRSAYGLQEFKEPLWAILAHLQVHNWWSRKKPATEPKEGPTWSL